VLRRLARDVDLDEDVEAPAGRPGAVSEADGEREAVDRLDARRPA
jgi:hypothetical protein